jgi:integrase
MPLTDAKARNAKQKSKQLKIFDTDGLFLLVSPAGGKWWRFKYRIGGKEKLISLGTYPEVSLAQARVRRDEARKQVADGIDPSQARKSLKAARVQNESTFEVVAREWHSKFTPTWTPGHAVTIKSRLEFNVFPWIGERPIIEIKAPELLMVLRRIESRGALETAHRVRSICGQVFRYAVATGRAERDPAADLRGAIPPVKPKHLSAMTDPKEVAGLLRAIDGYQGSFVTKSALRLAPYLFVRPGELRQMEWAQIDLEAAEWNIPAEKMKTRQPHLVPLAHQSLEILKELHPLTGFGKYVFPSPRTPKRPMSNNGVLSALRRMGFDKEEMTGHGFRAMARTILDEVLQFRADFIEHQLGHAVRDPNGRAYNRTAHLDERRKMMQTWADYLDGLKAGAKVIPLRRNAENVAAIP